MSSSKAAYRLRRELGQIQKEMPEFIWVTHKESNILLWSYLLAPPDDTPYGGGWYWGRLSFRPEYPFAPPSIQMVTPSGRFRPETKICMSMSDYHPESWNPGWSVSTILKGVLSFMLSDEVTTGAIESTDSDKRRLAKESIAWNQGNQEFCGLFPEFAQIRIDEAARRARLSTQDTGKSHFFVLCTRGKFLEAGLLSPEHKEACDQAVTEKKNADDAFRAGDIESAISAYDRALGIDGLPKSAVLYRNRAAALERRQPPSDAAVIADCSKAIDIDTSLNEPASRKAYIRRADAYYRSGDFHKARSDFHAAAASPGQDLQARFDALKILLFPPSPQHSSEQEDESSACTHSLATNKKKRRSKKKKKNASLASSENDATSTESTHTLEQAEVRETIRG